MRVLGMASLLLALFACSGSSSSVDGPGGAGGGSSSGNAGPGADSGAPGEGGAAPEGSADGASKDSAADAPVSSPGPIAEQSSFTTLYAMSDIHGHYAELGALLLKYGLIAAVPPQPSGMAWTGGDATLVIAGDMIDKGPMSLEVIEALKALQSSAQSSGGTVLVLLGNHEAEFLGDPLASKFTGAQGIDSELAAQTPAIDPSAFASGSDPRAVWVRHLPFGARVGAWFFSHAGDTGGLTIAELDAELAAALASAQGWMSTAIVGNSSLLESRGWYTSASVVTQNASKLGAKHIAFGHDPNAFGATGQMAAPSAYQGALVKLDTGLGANASSGALLRVRHAGANDIAEALLPDGTTQLLWSGPP